MNSPCPRQISQAGLVGDSEDLITEILLRLPGKDVVRLKLVSKRWLSLISDDRNFILGYKATSGIILVECPLSECPLSAPRYSYVSLDENERTTGEECPTRYIRSFDPHAPGPIKISDSCNGLLLCYAIAPTHRDVPCKLYVVNPTTHQFTTLPLPPTPEIYWNNINVAYDPQKSPVYRVCSVMHTKSVCYIHMYSSDTGFWNLFGAYNNLDLFPFGFNGVFCNGAIHWVCADGSSYRLDLNQKSIKKLRKPPLPEYWRDSSRNLKYFGESEGNLYFIVHDGSSSTFIVYELHNDCSGWFVKHSLDIKDISAAFPEINYHFQGPLPAWFYQLQPEDMLDSVLSFVKVKNEGPELLTCVLGKIISYSFKKNTFNELPDFHVKYTKYKAFNFHGTWSCI